MTLMEIGSVKTETLLRQNLPMLTFQ